MEIDEEDITEDTKLVEKIFSGVGRYWCSGGITIVVI